MSVTLTLTTRAGRVSVQHEETILATTPVDALPALPAAQGDLREAGAHLLAALGGPALLALLPQNGGRIILDIPPSDPADRVPWEFACLPNGQLLACLHDWLRLVDADAPPLESGAGDGLQLVALGADPLVDERGRAGDGYRLQLDREMRQLRRTLRESNKQVTAYRIPPTRQALRRALARPQATWLHLSCHGQVIETPNGPLARLLLEDDNGKTAYLTGKDLSAFAAMGSVRLVLLSACVTAEGQANLTRALVHNGLPAAIGMQGSFADPLSDDLAAALYEALLQGWDLATAVRQARQALLDHPQMAGLPVLYARRGGTAPLTLAAGRADLRRLDAAAAVRLPLEVQAPQVLLGRNQELYDLARLLHADAGGARVVTITGTGGMGKTALAAAFVERFGWRWPDGAVGVSFAAGEVDAARFRGELLARLTGDEQADLPPRGQEEALLAAAREWDGLILVDNYES
ncbi:MAG: CHAT domain-containing protein, partial [Anaerolineales bacterium]|nr:CHAT domain-containing protein [Anaerolineales bacterium]